MAAAGLRKDFDYYLAYQIELAAMYQSRFIVIEDGQVVGEYATAQQAVRGHDSQAGVEFLLVPVLPRACAAAKCDSFFMRPGPKLRKHASCRSMSRLLAVASMPPRVLAAEDVLLAMHACGMRSCRSAAFRSRKSRFGSASSSAAIGELVAVGCAHRQEGGVRNRFSACGRGQVVQCLDWRSDGAGQLIGLAAYLL